MTEESKGNDRVIRWQAITIAQLSYAINLILTFSVASLGFGVTLLLNNEFNPAQCQSCLFTLSLFLLLASGGFGIWCTINRLRDFRATANITKLEYKTGSYSELTMLRALTSRLGKKTWIIFWCQIGTFSTGFFLLVASVVISVGSKFS